MLSDWLNYFYSLLLYYGEYLLDYILLAKIYLQAYIFKPREYEDYTILYARLHKKNRDNIITCDDFTDITADINKLMRNRPIQWSQIPGYEQNTEYEWWIDIRYTLLNKIYKIIYKDDKPINFPLFNVSNVLEYNNNNGFKNGVLFAEKIPSNEDITHILKEYCGPFNDFYASHDHNNDMTIMHDHDGNLILQDCDKIILTDKRAKEIIIEKNKI